jgi:predicted  nucleic acid-binding Zn-ribbon protein
MVKNQDKDYSTATNPDPTLAKYEDEIKEIEKQLDAPGKEWQEIVDKAVRGETLTNQDKQRKIELERQINPMREQLEEKRSEAREAGKGIRTSAGKPVWKSEGE